MPAACVFWISIEAYSALLGPSGYSAMKALSRKAAEDQRTLDELIAMRDDLEARARQLNPKSLDPDLVDERIRAVLGYAQEGERIIPRREFEALVADAREKTDANLH